MTPFDTLFEFCITNSFVAKEFDYPLLSRVIPGTNHAIDTLLAINGGQQQNYDRDNAELTNQSPSLTD